MGGPHVAIRILAESNNWIYTWITKIMQRLYVSLACRIRWKMGKPTYKDEIDLPDSSSSEPIMWFLKCWHPPRCLGWRVCRASTDHDLFHQILRVRFLTKSQTLAKWPKIWKRKQAGSDDKHQQTKFLTPTGHRTFSIHINGLNIKYIE